MVLCVGIAIVGIVERIPDPPVVRTMPAQAAQFQSLLHHGSTCRLGVTVHLDSVVGQEIVIGRGDASPARGCDSAPSCGQIGICDASETSARYVARRCVRAAHQSALRRAPPALSLRHPRPFPLRVTPARRPGPSRLQELRAGACEPARCQTPARVQLYTKGVAEIGAAALCRPERLCRRVLLDNYPTVIVALLEGGKNPLHIDHAITEGHKQAQLHGS